MMKIPVVRSEYKTQINLTFNQMWTLREDLGLSDVDDMRLTVTEAFVARVQEQAEIWRSEQSRTATEKSAVTRVVRLIADTFAQDYENLLSGFRREVSTARVVVREGFKVSGFELDVNIENRDRISARFVSRRDGWDRPETMNNYAFSEISKNESGEFVCQFVVCESGYAHPRDADPRFATIAEAQARLTFLCEWDLALRIDEMNGHVAKTAAELAQLDMTLDLLAAAGVAHLFAA